MKLKEKKRKTVADLFLSFVIRGFTKFSRTDYVRWKSENRILPDGVNAKVCLCHKQLIFVLMLLTDATDVETKRSIKKV